MAEHLNISDMTKMVEHLNIHVESLYQATALISLCLQLCLPRFLSPLTFISSKSDLIPLNIWNSSIKKYFYVKIFPG